MLNVNLKKDRYKILESYNSNVYRVQDELSTCIYILKVCQNYETKQYKHQFKTEIDVLSKLNSFLAPSLVTCFEDEMAQYFVETYTVKKVYFYKTFLLISRKRGWPLKLGT